MGRQDNDPVRAQAGGFYGDVDRRDDYTPKAEMLRDGLGLWVPFEEVQALAEYIKALPVD